MADIDIQAFDRTAGLDASRYDPDTGLIRYFHPIDGGRRRRNWIDKHVVPSYVRAVEQNPSVLSGRVDAEVVIGSAQAATIEGIRLYLRLHQAPGAEPVRTVAMPGFGWLGDELTPLFACCCSEPTSASSRSLAQRDTIADIVHDPQQPEALTITLRPLLRPWLDGVVAVGVEAPLAFAPHDADRRRSLYLRNRVVPAVRAAFAEHPQLRSAVLTVAQYWDDQANDEVHLALHFSELATPDLSTEDSWWGVGDRANLPTIDQSIRHGLSVGYDLRLVALFAAYCPEDGDQNLEPWVNHAPYAVFRRDGEGVTTEVVGTKIRPWLDARMSTDTADLVESEGPDPSGEAGDDWLREPIDPDPPR